MAAFAAIGVNRASRNLSLDSPTGVAIDKETRRQAQRDEGIERLGRTVFRRTEVHCFWWLIAADIAATLVLVVAAIGVGAVLLKLAEI